MRPLSDDSESPTAVHAAFIDTLSSFSRLHRAQRWEGTFGEFLDHHPARQSRARSRAQPRIHLGHAALARPRRPPEATENSSARELFKRELFGIDEPLARVVDYFKAAAAGSDVGRRLLLLLGPPSGGKSTLAILLKRGLEEYSRTDEGALYAIQGSPLRENPLNLIPDQPARRVPRALRRAMCRENCRPGRATSSSASSRVTSCACRSSACFSPRPRASASAPTRRTIRPPRTSPTWSARSISPKSRRSAMKATRAPGPGRARSTPPAAACSR